MSQVNAGTVTAVIRADVTNFNRGMVRVNQTLNVFNRSTTTGATGINGMTSSIIKLGIAYKALDIVKTVTSNIVKLGAELELVTLSMEAMTGNNGGGTRLVNIMRQMGKETPFATNQLLAASKSLIAFGFGVKEIPETLKMLGNISAGTGKDLKALSIIFGQIRTAGKLYGQDLLQLVQAGFNPLLDISKRTGKSLEDLRRSMKSGAGVTFEEVLLSFKNATSEGGMFFNLMAKQTATLAGQWERLKDEFSILGQDIGLMLIEPLKEAVSLASDLAESFGRISLGKLETGTDKALLAGGLAGGAVTATAIGHYLLKYIGRGLSKSGANLLGGFDVEEYMFNKSSTQMMPKHYTSGTAMESAGKGFGQLSKFNFKGALRSFSSVFDFLKGSSKVIDAGGKVSHFATAKTLGTSFAGILAVLEAGMLGANAINDFSNDMTGNDRGVLAGMGQSLVDINNFLQEWTSFTSIFNKSLKQLPSGLTQGATQQLKSFEKWYLDVTESSISKFLEIITGKSLMQLNLGDEDMTLAKGNTAITETKTSSQKNRQEEFLRRNTLGSSGVESVMLAVIRDFSDSFTKKLIMDVDNIGLYAGSALKAIDKFGLKLISDIESPIPFTDSKIAGLRDFIAGDNPLFKSDVERDRRQKRGYESNQFPYGQGPSNSEPAPKFTYVPIKFPEKLFSATLTKEGYQVPDNPALNYGSAGAFSAIQQNPNTKMDQIVKANNLTAEGVRRLVSQGVKVTNLKLAN